jgi:hypothetical protein
MTEHQKGGKMFFASIMVESGQISKGFWNTDTKATTKHPFIQT